MGTCVAPNSNRPLCSGSATYREAADGSRPTNRQSRHSPPRYEARGSRAGRGYDSLRRVELSTRTRPSAGRSRGGRRTSKARRDRSSQPRLPGDIGHRTFLTLDRYANERARFLQTLNTQLSDLARSQPHQPLVANLNPLIPTLTSMRKDETD